MESQRINILLNKYFEAETTLDEENELINYFNSDRVDENLKQYITLFGGIKDLSEMQNIASLPDLQDDIMNHILESENRGKTKYRLMIRVISAIAASVILGLLAINYYGNKDHLKDTYTDPDQAYEAAVKTLDYMAGKYNEGFTQLKPIGKIENAATPFYSGMKMLEKGFNKMEILNKEL